MKFILPSVELIKQGNTITTILKHIELCGRIAYKSADKITETSYNRFIKMLEDNKHTSVLEHGTVYLKAEIKKSSNDNYNNYLLNDPLSHYKYNKYSTYTLLVNDHSETAYVTTNYRVLFQNGWLDDIKFMIPFDKEHHEPRYTFKIITSRSISHQLVRHRVFSFTQSSQRYCNYSKDKFGGEITYVIPYWARSSKLKESELDYANDNVVKLIQLCKDAEDSYLSMISNGATPQEAREVLPNACMTEIIMTGTSKQWEDFFVLRCANDAHPDIKILADQIKSIIYKIEGREE